MKPHSITLRLLFITVLIFSISACSDKSSDSKTSASHDSNDNKVASKKPNERALERWNALIKRDWQKAYSYQTPSYRKIYSVEDFRNSFGQAVKWESIKYISSKDISKELIDIKLELTVLFYDGNMKIPNLHTERWQLIDGNWWHTKEN